MKKKKNQFPIPGMPPHIHTAACSEACAAAKGRMLQIATALQRARIPDDILTLVSLMSLTSLLVNRAGLSRAQLLQHVGEMWDEAEQTRGAQPAQGGPEA